MLGTRAEEVSFMRELTRGFRYGVALAFDGAVRRLADKGRVGGLVLESEEGRPDVQRRHLRQAR